jgi:hypothetical protein
VVEFPPRPDPVGIVDAVDTAPVGVMKCTAVFDSVWTSSGRLDLAGFEFHGVALGESEFVAVKAQEYFELIIQTARHSISTT